MEYREHPPAPALRPHVACYWRLRGPAGQGGAAYRVLPDGCLDLLFDLRDDPAGRVVGVMTTALVTAPGEPGGSADLLGVRFRPGEAAAFLAVAARATRDRALALRDVCGRWGADLGGRLREAGGDPARFAILDAALLARGRRFAPDRRLRAAIAGLAASPGVSAIAGLAASPGLSAIARRAASAGASSIARRAASAGASSIARRAASAGASSIAALAPPADVSSVADRVGLSERHLRRLFDEHVGLGPKAFARVVRVQSLVRALDALGDGARARWADLAAAHGFADQAHLVRDVRELAGVTPTALLRERATGRIGMSENVNPPSFVRPTVGA